MSRAFSLLYQVAYAEYHRHSNELIAYWAQSMDILPQLHREIISLNGPVLKRDNVKGGGNANAHGCCLGLSRGTATKPFFHMRKQYTKIMQMIPKRPNMFDRISSSRQFK